LNEIQSCFFLIGDSEVVFEMRLVNYVMRSVFTDTLNKKGRTEKAIHVEAFGVSRDRGGGVIKNGTVTEDKLGVGGTGGLG
jgi:hypothetical protein